MIETPKTPSFWALWSWAGMHIGTWANKADADAAMAEYTGATMKALYEEPYWLTPFGRFRLGDLVRKTRGSSWTGRVVGFYSTKLTPIGYAVESLAERGSVQIDLAEANWQRGRNGPNPGRQIVAYRVSAAPSSQAQEDGR